MTINVGNLVKKDMLQVNAWLTGYQWHLLSQCSLGAQGKASQPLEGLSLLPQQLQLGSCRTTTNQRIVMNSEDCTGNRCIFSVPFCMKKWKWSKCYDEKSTMALSAAHCRGCFCAMLTNINSWQLFSSNENFKCGTHQLRQTPKP